MKVTYREEYKKPVTRGLATKTKTHSELHKVLEDPNV
jgi:hypothetical protein